MSVNKVWLEEDSLPRDWYNIQADLPRPLDPPLNPATKKPVAPQDLAPIFPEKLIEQEVSTERWIRIPERVREIYKIWRPTPLHRARRLEEFLKTPARIYYKNESVSPPGSHKPNTAVAQAYYNKMEGVKRLTTETGAGQWGSALSFGCNLFDLECTVYMVRVSYEQKPYRKIMMRVWGADVIPSPSDTTKAGKAVLEKNPDSSGSLGIAISEAIEEAATHQGAKYSLGSVLNHVLLHQTVIGLETKKQFEKAGDYPDVMIGCVGGGSNFPGLFFPFVKEKLDGERSHLRFIAAEPTACPTLTKGPYAYDFGDIARQTPLLKMFTLGHEFVPPPIHSGGLRYHGDAPLLCLLHNEKIVEARAYNQIPVFKAACIFANTEGILPAPEAAHAIRATIDEALECKKNEEEKVIVFNLSGHGYFDLSAYEAYLNNKLEDYEYPEKEIKKTLQILPEVGS